MILTCFKNTEMVNPCSLLFALSSSTVPWSEIIYDGMGDHEPSISKDGSCPAQDIF
jgi:hypothetical protein